MHLDLNFCDWVFELFEMLLHNDHFLEQRGFIDIFIVDLTFHRPGKLNSEKFSNYVGKGF